MKNNHAFMNIYFIMHIGYIQYVLVQYLFQFWLTIWNKMSLFIAVFFSWIVIYFHALQVQNFWISFMFTPINLSGITGREIIQAKYFQN